MANHAPTPKSATEPPNTKRKLKNSKEPCTNSLSAYSRLASVKKQSERAYLRSSLETLYLGTFSLLAVTHLDTWLASSCTRAIIWSILDLGATSYSSSFLAKLLMHDTTQCIAALERDLFWVASSGAFVHTFPVVSRPHPLASWEMTNCLHLRRCPCFGDL